MSRKEVTVTASGDNEFISIADLEDRSAGKKRKAESTRDEPEKRKCTFTSEENSRFSTEEARYKLCLMGSRPVTNYTGILHAIIAHPELLNTPGEDCYLFTLYVNTVYTNEDPDEEVRDEQANLFFEMFDQLPVDDCVDRCEFTNTLVQLADYISDDMGPDIIRTIYPFLWRVYDRTRAGTKGRKAIMYVLFEDLFSVEDAKHNRAFDILNGDQLAIEAFQCFMTEVSRKDLSADNAEQLLEWIEYAKKKSGGRDLATDPFFCDTAEASWPVFWRHICELAGTA